MCETQIAVPVAKMVPVNLETHGHVRTDNYYWLRERDNPEVIAYLEAENAYTEAMMAHTDGLQEALSQRSRGASSRPTRRRPTEWATTIYYTRYEEGKEYPIHCRKTGDARRTRAGDARRQRAGRGPRFFSVGRLRGQLGPEPARLSRWTRSGGASTRSTSRTSRPGSCWPT